jgi:hypothetical protein
MHANSCDEAVFFISQRFDQLHVKQIKKIEKSLSILTYTHKMIHTQAPTHTHTNTQPPAHPPTHLCIWLWCALAMPEQPINASLAAVSSRFLARQASRSHRRDSTSLRVCACVRVCVCVCMCVYTCV